MHDDYPEAIFPDTNAPFWAHNPECPSLWLGGNHPQRKPTPLPAGSYKAGMHPKLGPFITEHPIVSDELVLVQDDRQDHVRREINTFFKSAHLYKRYGFAHRRGLLLHGPSGSGKSCLLRSLCQKHIDSGGFVIYHNEHLVYDIMGAQLIQRIHPGSKVIIVLEELDDYIEENGESDLLNTLDGPGAIDGVLFIATTNHPERLNRRILNRPRRFDRVEFIGMPTGPMRRAYFLHKLHLEEAEVDEWTAASEGFSFAALADLVISVKCLGGDLLIDAARLRERLHDKPTSDNTWPDETPTPTAKVEQDPPAPTPTHPFLKDMLVSLDTTTAGGLG